jgi:hypothetical protein
MTKIIQPTYTCIQPSTGKKIKFRPFTTKEHKALLLSLAEDDIGTISEAIKSTIAACTDIDPDNVPYYDLEFIFLQIRSKAIGEIIDLIGGCQCEPNVKNEFSVDIADLQIDPPPPKGNAKISIEGTPYTIEIRHPSIDGFIEVFKSPTADTDQAIVDSIVAVYTEDEIVTDIMTNEQKLEFIESMTPKQEANLSEFMRKMPIVKLSANYKCKKCGTNHEHTLKGFENFFV